MTTLDRGGIKLAFEERGRGEPPLLFVHGWACDHAFFGRQVEYFSRSHRTIAVDLRGHGASDAPEQEYTLGAFVDDLAWVCRQIEVERPVVVGHSMGAAVALLLAATHPEVPGAVVMIDGGTRLVAGAGSGGVDLTGEGYQDAMRGILAPMFLPASDPELRRWITERMLRTPRHVLASARRHLLSTAMADAAAACRVPALYIQAAAPRPELERFRELCHRLQVGRTVGAGHFNLLEVPDQVNAMIARFLATELRA